MIDNNPAFDCYLIYQQLYSFDHNQYLVHNQASRSFECQVPLYRMKGIV